MKIAKYRPKHAAERPPRHYGQDQQMLREVQKAQQQNPAK